MVFAAENEGTRGGGLQSGAEGLRGHGSVSHQVGRETGISGTVEAVVERQEWTDRNREDRG